MKNEDMFGKFHADNVQNVKVFDGALVEYTMNGNKYFMNNPAYEYYKVEKDIRTLLDRFESTDTGLIKMLVEAIKNYGDKCREAGFESGRESERGD